jgi:hypothetical protein
MQKMSIFTKLTIVYLEELFSQKELILGYHLRIEYSRG